MKIYCVLGSDPICDGEFQGESWLIDVFDTKEKADDFIIKNKENDEVCPLTYHNTRCDLYIMEKEIK